MPFSIIPILLLAVPLAEIAAFVLIGREIGVLWTLAMVFFTAVLGSILLRVQGLGLIARIRAETEAGRVPGRELIHGVMILVAGILLLTPGFITDAVGFLLFVPAIRDAGWQMFRSRVTFITPGGMKPGGDYRNDPRSGMNRKGSIDLDESEYEREPDPDSPWSGR
ncbi:FxsA family protein [Hoeflea sp. CAU 1731]